MSRAPRAGGAAGGDTPQGEVPEVESRVDLSDEQVHWDLGGSQSYAEYLHLDRLFSAQEPLSAEHDEMLFIIVHHVSELWMRLLLHELRGVIDCVRRDDLGPSFKMFDRIGRVQAQLLAVWDVLASMTPADYSAFRNLLGRASGFQSLQYRLLEFTLGNRNASYVGVHKDGSAASSALLRALAAPSLYDEVLRLLSQRGYGIPPALLTRDFSQPYAPSKQVTAAWLGVYHNADKDWDLYELAERLLDLDHRFQLWRFQHMKTVERIIGYKPGTGGTAGVAYLAKALRLRLFPELWELRTSM
ncbi:MAG TPA: tryptophan 2,3-dioxygenase family protein [Steroidobacteraceae bacterium]|nr:tryptophan 2,3-dioxygenase family protein [Steroidobacteraceae bacterium]